MVAFGGRARQQVQVHTDGDHERRAGHHRGDDAGERFAEPASEQKDQHESGKRQRGNQPDEIEHGAVIPSAPRGRLLMPRCGVA